MTEILEHDTRERYKYAPFKSPFSEKGKNATLDHYGDNEHD